MVELEVLSCVHHHHHHAQNEIDKVKSDKRALADDINKLEQQLNNSRTDLKDRNARLKEMESVNEHLSVALSQLKVEISNEKIKNKEIRDKYDTCMSVVMYRYTSGIKAQRDMCYE